MTPRAEYWYGVGTERHATRAIQHYKLVLAWFDANAKRTLQSTNPYTRFVAHSVLTRARVNIRAHRWLQEVGAKAKAEGWNRLHPYPPHYQGWLCIHRFEGSWRDSGDPYWGGLQMDRGFMRSYATRALLRRGWADKWTPLEQMWVAERAFNSGRGYGPWPNTARYCGLL